MRIISGTHKGRQLHPPAKEDVRPTTDIAKEALFNIFRNYVDFEDINVLDLFAGTGSISFEFASRGARKVISVEQNARLVKFISETARQLQFSNIQVIRGDVFRSLEFFSTPFDIIFADPPYNMQGIAEIPELIFEKKLLQAEGWLILEHSDAFDFSAHPMFCEVRQYGKVHFSIFQNV